MKVFVIGGDGYLGWPMSLRLSARGHDVTIIDSQVRREIDKELGTGSLVPIRTIGERLKVWGELSGRWIDFYRHDAGSTFTGGLIEAERPDAIVHFGEIRSAPYSMIDHFHAEKTQLDNLRGTLRLLFEIAAHAPDCHLVKLGTMGEYGTPNIDIEEGFLEVEHKGRRDVLPYPMRPGSWYHLSKLHDSNNIQFAARNWGLRATDLHQGIVYGADTEETRLDDRLATRFDYDGIWGTVLNRFCVQAALGHPLTVYGRGGQTRGLLDIRDTMACIELALESPAGRGEYRVLNQFTEQFSVRQLAEKVQAQHRRMTGREATIERVENPRNELEEHYYRAAHKKLVDMGLRPHLLGEKALSRLLSVAQKHSWRAIPATLLNSPAWGAARRASADHAPMIR